jgi:hypothetical protein
MREQAPWLVSVVLATSVACSRTNAAPEDLESGKTPTGTIDPGPDTPSRDRAAPTPVSVAGGGGGGGEAGVAGGGAGVAGGGASAGSGIKSGGGAPGAR